MSKSLQRGILFSICVALVLALSLTLVFFAGGGDKNILSAPEGQVSGVADAAANAYEHGSDIGRTVSSNARTVTDESTFLDALANNYDINLKANLELTSSQSFLKKDNNGNISADPATSGTALVYSGTIYGNGYNITIAGSQAITNNTAAWDCGPKGYADAANVYGGLVGKLTGQIYDLNVTMKSGTMEKIKGNDGGDRWLDVGVIAGIVDDVNARIENCSVTIPANTQITALKSPISNVGWGQSSAGTQYVRAAGIAAELNNGTIVNCTVTNNGCISAGLQENKDDNSITNGYYGAAANAVAWVNNGTLNNIIVKGSGKLIGLKTAAISVVNNSNISPPPTTNAYNGYTGTYEFCHGDDGGNWSTASMYVSGARQAIANFYQASNATTRGGANKDQTSHELANSGTTLTVNPSTYTIYFDPTKSSDDTRLAVLFNNENYSAGAEYELYGASRQISNAQISGANGKVLARNLPATPSTWNSGNNFTASVQIAFDPTSYAKLTKYDHGYVSGGSPSGTPIGTGEDFEAVFSPSGKISGTDYYLTNDIVITGFTGKEFSGTLDGNGHTIFITGANTCAAQHIGGIVGTLTGTIKNVRVVLVNSVTANTSVSNANVGLVAGHINGGSLINVSVDIPADVTLKHTDSGNDSSLGGIAGSAVSGATFTNVTMNFNGTLSNIKTSGASGGYWPFTSAFVGKPYFKDSANSSADCATFNNIIIRGNGTFASQSSADDEPPYYAAIGIIQHKGVTNSTAAVYNVNGLIYDFNPKFADNQGATSGNHGACYGLFVNNNNKNPGQVQYYDSLVNYGSNGVYNASGAVIEAYAFNENGNAPVPNPSKIKNITETVTNVTGSTVKAYFMPGDSASENLTLVASASNWNGVTQLQLDGAAPAVTSADDGSNKVVNVAKSTAVNISGENLTLSPYNPYTVITASLVTDTKVYDGNPFAAQVSFTASTGAVTLTAGDDYNITYTDGGNTGETNANASGGTYSLTVTLKGTASDGTQYVFDAQGTKTKTFTYTITPLEVTGTWSVRGLEITYGDSAPDYDQYISIELTNEGTIPGGLTATDITGSGFTSNYTSGTRAGETVTITAGTFTVGSGFTASNYNFSGITGSGSVEVQKREITITAADSDLAVGHIVAIYGGTNYVTSQADLQNLLTWANVSDYVENVYGTDEIGFTITAVAHEQTGDGATYAPGEAVQEGEWAKLPAKDTYYITVTSANNNYTVAENNYFKYQVSPAELVVTGVVWDDTALDTITYDGQKHTAKLKVTGLVGEDTYDSALIVSLTLNSEAVENGVNAGTYTVDVYVNEDDKYYDLGVSGDSDDLTLTISPITLTPTDISGTFTEYTSSNLPTGASFVTSGILAADSGVTVAVTSWVNDPSTNVVGSGSYVAVNTYTANLAIQGDDNGNYALSATTAEFEITAYNLAKATITVEASGLVYDGTEKTATVTVKAGEADITDLVTITGNKATNAGDSYTVSISSKDGNTTGSKNADTTWSIAKADYNMEGVTFEDGSITYDGESHTLTVSGELPTGEDGIKVTVEYTAANGGEVNITNVGSVKITATFATTSTNYNTPAAKTATLTIEKKAVTIEWSIGDIIQGTDPDKVKDTAKVTNKGGILDGDTYEFTVTLPLKDGSGDYTTTTPEGTVINVTPSLTFTDPTDAGNYNITYSPVTLEWEVQQPEVAISVTAPTVEKTYAKGFVTEADFLSNFIGSFTETSLSAVISADNFDITITKQGEGEPTPVGVGRLDVGTYSVAISAAAGSQYTIADGSTLTYTYTVTAEQWTATVAAPEDGLTYNGLDQFSSLVITPGANNTCDGAPTIAAVVTGGEMKNAGTYNVTLQLQTADGAYTGGNFVLNSGSEDYSAQIEIAKLKVEIEWNAFESLVYTGSAFEMTAEITNKVGADEVTATVELSGNNINVTADGFTYTVTALAGAAAGNYTIEGAANLISDVKTITPATLTVEGKEGATLSREYDGNTTAANSFLTADFLTVTGNAPSDDIYAMLNATVAAEKTILNADTYTVTITFDAQAVGASNYNGADINVSLTYTVNRKVITVAFDGYENLTYTASAHQITATVQGFVNDEATDITDLVVISGNSVTEGEAINAGSYTATVSKTAVEGAYDNYTLASDATEEFTIAQATLTLTAAEGASLSKVYDGIAVDPESLLTAENVTVAGMQNGEDAFELGILSIAPEADSEIKNAAGYKLTVSVNEGNYTAQDLELTYTVTAKLIGVEWSNTEFTYDGAVHKPTATATNLVGGETLTLTVTGEQTNASESPYTATVAKDSVTGNYMLEEDATTEFTIAPKPISVAWSNTTLTYDGSEQKPNAAIVNGALIGDDQVEITVEGAQINANTDGSYTATAVITGGEDMGNYTLDSTATTSFTIAPAEIALSLTVSKVSGSDSAPVGSLLTWNVSGAVEVAKTADGWTLTSGETVYTVTVSGGDDIEGLLDMLQLTLNGAEYTGTPYGTRVEDGKLAVASTNPNYTVELVTTVTINIVPDISIEIRTGAEYPVSAVYSKDKTYTADDDFAGYFYIDGQPDGDWAYSVEGVESGSFSNVGTYTVKATFTIASGIPLENHFTFTITQATVTDVVLNGDGVYTYGELKAGDTVSVTVTYSDGNTATVNAGFDAAKSTGDYVKAGESVELTLTGDDGANANYAKVNGQTVTVSVSKAEITADISYIDDFAVEGVLTLPYIGSTGYSHNITVTLYGVLGGDVVEGELETEIINANTYGDLTFALYGDDSYVITNAADLSVVVTPAEITVEWSNVEGLTYNGAEQAPTATVGEGLVSGDDLKITVSGAETDANTDGGSYTATAAITGGEDMGNYVLAADATVEFTIAPKSIGVEWTNTEFTYDGTAHKPTATATDLVGEDTLTLNVTGERTNANAEGEHYTATVKAFIDGNYKLEQDATVKFTIARKTVIVAWGNTEFTYNGAEQAPTATVGEGLVSGDDLKITVSGAETDANTDGGSYTATAAITGGEDMGNYVLAEDATVDFTIKQLEVVLKWEAVGDLVYNGKEHAATATVSNKVDGDAVKVSVERAADNDYVNVTEQGFVYVAIGLTGDDAGNYRLPEKRQSEAFNVKPAQVKITWNFGDGAKITYGDSVDAVKALVNTDALNGEIPGVEAELSFEVIVDNYSATTNAGTEVTFTVTAKLPEGATAKNYEITVNAADGNTLTVGKATLTLAIAESASLTKVYDGDAVTLGSLLTAGNVSVEGMKNGENAFTLGILAISGTDEMTNAGAYSGSVSVIDDCNYTAEPLQFSYKITPKPIGVAWGTTEFTYNGDAQVPTATATGLVSGDSLTLNVTGAQTNAGSYTATVAAFEQGNYKLAEKATVEFTIAPKSIGVEWTNTAFTYDGTAHKPTATATGLVDGDSLTLTVVTDAQTNAGSYTATVKAFVQGNYKLEGDSTQTFTIARRGLDVAEVAEAVYGDLQVSGTLVTGTYTAFVAYNDEEIELIVNVKTAALSRAAAEYLDAGEYEVTIALANENGNFSLNGATLNAETEKMEVQSTLDVAPKTVEVGYTTSSGVYDAKGISITLEKFEDMLIEGDDPAVNIYINDAPYTGRVVLDAGEYTVRYESADPNYAFAPVSATFTVAPKSVTPNFDLNTGSGSLQITGGGKLEIEEGEETDIVAAIDNFMQSSGVSEEEMSIAVSGDLKLEDMATWAPGTYTVTVTLSGNHSGSMQFTVEVSEKVELPPPVAPELPETPVEAGSGNDWVLPLVIAIVALIDLALLVAIGVAAKKRA